MNGFCGRGPRSEIDRDEALARARTPKMYRARDQLLASARFAANQNGDVSRRDFVDRLEHAHHRARLADHVFEDAGLETHLFEQLIVLALEQLRLHHLAHFHAQLVVVERLGQVVLGAGLHRFDGDSLRAECGNHQHGACRIELAHVLEQFEPAHSLHAEVGDDHVEQSRLDLLDRFFARLRGLDFVALLGEEPFERDNDSALVVNYQQSAFQFRSLEVGADGPPAASGTIGVVTAPLLFRALFCGAGSAAASPTMSGDSADDWTTSSLSRTESLSGIASTNSVPCPTLLCTSIDPRCESITFFATPSPSPVPLVFDV